MSTRRANAFFDKRKRGNQPQRTRVDLEPDRSLVDEVRVREARLQSSTGRGYHSARSTVTLDPRLPPEDAELGLEPDGDGIEELFETAYEDLGDTEAVDPPEKKKCSLAAVSFDIFRLFRLISYCDIYSVVPCWYGRRGSETYISKNYCDGKGGAMHGMRTRPNALIVKLAA